MKDIPKQEDIPEIIAHRERYDNILYTPLPEAYEELGRRRQDVNLEKKVSVYLKDDILEPLREKPKAVLARSLMSPNIETRRFADLVENGELEPLYLEHHADKFASSNESKRMLGRLYFFNGNGADNALKMDSHNIIDFAAANGACISSVKTKWGQDFVEFHHRFFDACHRNISHTFYNTSPWLGAHGGKAELYYRPFLALFIRHGILFENAMLNEHEISFTSRVFLPTFLSVYREFGIKPLIVPLEPTHTEESPHWTSYPDQDMKYVTERLYQRSSSAVIAPAL